MKTEGNILKVGLSEYKELARRAENARVRHGGDSAQFKKAEQDVNDAWENLELWEQEEFWAPADSE